MRTFKQKLLSMTLLLLAGPLAAQAPFPAVIEEKLGALGQEELAFLRGPGPLRVMSSQAKLLQALESRDPEQVRNFVGDMMAAVEQFAYDPERDLGAIPMNPEADVFNRLVREPEALWEVRRDPGPFSVHRYVRPVGGIPTFAGAPVALNASDLRAGRIEVAIAGIPQSMSSGNRDARNGPGALRAMHGMAAGDVYALLDPAEVLNIADYGDISVDRMSLELSVDYVREVAREMIDTGAVPFFVGGDRSVTYSTVAAVREVRESPLTVVQLGAHYDARPTGAHSISDRDPVYRLMGEGLVDGEDLIQIGLRGPSADAGAFAWLRKQGVKYHTMAEVESRGWSRVMVRALEEARDSGNPVYVSLDVSVLDPAQLSAAGRAVPGGLTVRELLPLLRRLCAETEIAGFELMDLAPMLDLSYVSALNANYLMNACLTGMALRKQGIKERNYLDPLALDHGQ